MSKELVEVELSKSQLKYLKNAIMIQVLIDDSGGYVDEEELLDKLNRAERRIVGEDE
jgi:hypothetical protein